MSIINDSTVEGTEDFSIVLSSFNPDVNITSPSKTDVLILDNGGKCYVISSSLLMSC